MQEGTVELKETEVREDFCKALSLDLMGLPHELTAAVVACR